MAHGPEKIDEVKRYLKQGLSNRKIAEQASVSVDFVKKVRAEAQKPIDFTQQVRDRQSHSPHKKSAKTTQKTTHSKPKSKAAFASHKKPPNENDDDKNHPLGKNHPAQFELNDLLKLPIQVEFPEKLFDMTPEEIDREHRENLRLLMDTLMLNFAKKDFNALKCTKITLEAMLIGMTAERKLHQIESKGKQKDFSGVTFNVKGQHTGIETEALPNQDEHDWPNPYQQTSAV